MNFERLPAWQFSARSKPRYIRYVVAIAVCIFLLHSFIGSTASSRKGSKIQHDFTRNSRGPAVQVDRLEAVKREFMHAWTGYKDHAWMSDSLSAVSGTRKDQFCGWSATLVDSLDSLYIMGLMDEFDEAVEATLTINFMDNTMTCQVNAFESTIRYLGGILAAYDLSQDARLLPKLVELGELLHSAFNSTNGMPCSYCDLGLNRDDELITPGHNVPLADIGSFYLEFARLWQITGQEKYLNTVIVLTEAFERSQNRSSIPGLWPEIVDASSVDGPAPDFATRSGVYSLGALSDSAYEYLVKAHLLLGGLTDQYAQMWASASHQIKGLMLFRAYIPHWDEMDVLFSGVATRYEGSPDMFLEPRTQHLACFAGGMFAMSARMFDSPDDLKIGEALTNGCVWAYDNSPTGIMPETLTLLTCPGFDGKQCAWNETLWSEARHAQGNCNNQECTPTEYYPPGYLMVMDTHYGLRPEAIESVFVLYRVTGDPKWRDIGWRMFTKIIEHTRTPYGHTSLQTVMEMTEQVKYEGNKQVLKMAAVQKDEMESFWLAETLKYFYLLFSDPSLIDLDEYVLNTEAHPFRLTSGTRGFPR